MYMYGTPSFENTYIDAFTSAPVHILVVRRSCSGRDICNVHVIMLAPCSVGSYWFSAWTCWLPPPEIWPLHIAASGSVCFLLWLGCCSSLSWKSQRPPACPLTCHPLKDSMTLNHAISKFGSLPNFNKFSLVFHVILSSISYAAEMNVRNKSI